MKPQRIISSIGLLALVVWSAPSLAQEEDRRHGFWISGGIGGGVNTASVSDTEHRGGLAGFIRAGGAPSGHVVIGTELVGWITERDSVTTSRGNIMAIVQYYPSKTGGLFFKGGLGGAGLGVATPADPGTLVTSVDGFGMTLGGGYEFRLSRIVSLTTNVDWLFQAFDKTDLGPETSSLFLLTVGLTFPKIG
jgi:hypothetical protein